MIHTRSVLLSALVASLTGILSVQAAFAACPPVTTLDDGECGHWFIGTWHGATGGYRGDQFYSQGAPRQSQTNDSRSMWRFEGIEPGKYEVYVTWSAAESGLSGIATNAPFTIWDGNVNIGTVRVNQQIDPKAQGGVLFDGKYWLKINEVGISNSFLQVNLRSFANGKVLADAVRIVKRGGGSTASGRLVVVGKSLATSDTVVENQKDVHFFRFEARADANADVLLTDLIFEAAANAPLTNGQNYTLWVDTNGDGTVDTRLQTGVSAIGSQVIFDNFVAGGYVIPKQASTIFEVHADIAASISPVNSVLSLRFDTGSTFITSEWVADGTPLQGIGTKNPAGEYEPSEGTYVNSGAAGQMQVQTAYSTLFRLLEKGDLYVSLSAVPVRSRQLLGGALGEDILRLTMHADHENVEVLSLVFTGTGAQASAFATNVDRLELYHAGVVTPFAIATVGACGVDPVPSFSMCAMMNNSELSISKGSSIDVQVRPRMRNDEQGSISGNDIMIRLGSQANAVTARGSTSSNDLDPNDSDAIPEGEVFIGLTSASGPNTMIKSKFNEVVHSKVVSITNADPNANGTAVPTGTNRDIAQFKFSAAVANNTKNGVNKWTMDTIFYNVNATNVDLDGSSFEFYNKADATVSAPCTLVSATNSSALIVRCDNLVSSGVNTAIDPGTDSTLVLRVDIQNAKVVSSMTSTLQVSFQSYTDPFATTLSPSGSHVRWLDKDNASSTPFLWIDYPETAVNGTSYNS